MARKSKFITTSTDGLEKSQKKKKEVKSQEKDIKKAFDILGV